MYIWIDGQTASIQLPCLCSDHSRLFPATHWQQPSRLFFAAGLQERFESIAFHRHQKMVWWKQSSGEKHRRAEKHLRPSVSTLVRLGFDEVSWFDIAGATCCSVDVLLGSASYSPEAPELQIRKMADLCFLVQHYEMAFSCYHTAKKDFLSDTAMIYAAGALVRPRLEHHGLIK